MDHHHRPPQVDRPPLPPKPAVPASPDLDEKKDESARRPPQVGLTQPAAACATVCRRTDSFAASDTRRPA